MSSQFIKFYFFSNSSILLAKGIYAIDTDNDKHLTIIISFYKE